MKPYAAAFAVVCLSLVLPAQGQAQTDPLWEKAVAHAAQMKKWAPGEVQLLAEGRADGKIDRTRVRQRLTGWDKGNPVYETTQIEPPPEAGKKPGKSEFDMKGIGEATESLLRTDARVRRRDNQPLHGKSWTLFEVAQSKGPMDVNVRLWVDPATGVAHQMESTMHGTMMMDMSLLTAYRPHPQAGSLPSRFDFRMKVLVPFVDATVKIASDMERWVPRPAEAGQGAAGAAPAR
ncbi:MAG: hypothetical protein JWP65_2564 [Ramlibacter sp.]|jgi:hypothetical protein|nr:hypothetical protein [Ramlibacter sp.]MDB5790255.1 hypothetical protein [Massilia sp.]